MSVQPTLYRRLVLENPVDVADGMGGFTQTWQVLGAHWAQVTAQAARETKIAGRDTAIVPYRIIVRSAPIGVASRPNPTQRFREFERVFNILAVAEYGTDGRFLECWTEEGRG